MSHKSRNQKRKMEKEWAMRRKIRKKQNIYYSALSLRIVFAKEKEK